MTWNEDDIWFAVIGEDSYDDYPVVAGSERAFDHPKENTEIFTFELSEPHVDIGGEAFLAVWDNGLFHDRARVISKTRLQAFAGMCKVMDHYDTYNDGDVSLSDRYEL